MLTHMVQIIATVFEEDNLSLEYILITFVNCVLIIHLTRLCQIP
jgi:hypothetical protein